VEIDLGGKRKKGKGHQGICGRRGRGVTGGKKKKKKKSFMGFFFLFSFS